MGKITTNINFQIQLAMKVADEIRLSTLRLLASALSYEKIAKMHELTDEEEIVVVRREAKKRIDAATVYDKVGSTDRAEKERKELAILKTYLPPEMSDEDLSKIVREVVGSMENVSMSDMGKVIGAVKVKVPSADGGRIVNLVNQVLNESKLQ